MNLEISSIGFASQRASSRYVAIEEALRASFGAQRSQAEGRGTESRAATQVTVTTISDAARRVAASAENALMGQARCSGIYLREGDSPGTLQRIDLTV